MNVAAGAISADDPGLLEPAETSLLIDELTMAASYNRRGMNARAVFELSRATSRRTAAGC